VSLNPSPRTRFLSPPFFFCREGFYVLNRGRKFLFPSFSDSYLGTAARPAIRSLLPPLFCQGSFLFSSPLSSCPERQHGKQSLRMPSPFFSLVSFFFSFFLFVAKDRSSRTCIGRTYFSFQPSLSFLSRPPPPSLPYFLSSLLPNRSDDLP